MQYSIKMVILAIKTPEVHGYCSTGECTLSDSRVTLQRSREIVLQI